MLAELLFLIMIVASVVGLVTTISYQLRHIWDTRVMPMKAGSHPQVSSRQPDQVRYLTLDDAPLALPRGAGPSSEPSAENRQATILQRKAHPAVAEQHSQDGPKPPDTPEPAHASLPGAAEPAPQFAGAMPPVSPGSEKSSRAGSGGEAPDLGKVAGLLRTLGGRLATQQATLGGGSGPLVSREQGIRRMASMVHEPDKLSVFVPSRLGLAFRTRGLDLWTEWPDVNRRNISGNVGTALLTGAFDLIEQSRARPIAEDLHRKGIGLSFGRPEEFTGAHAETVALFHFSQEARPPAAPPTPMIVFNPAFATESPAVLAAALVHEGTHLQAYLDGSFWAGTSNLELEFSAWWNQTAFWDEVRGSCWPPDTPLERELEFAYQTTIRGEGALRDMLAALYLTN